MKYNRLNLATLVVASTMLVMHDYNPDGRRRLATLLSEWGERSMTPSLTLSPEKINLYRQRWDLINPNDTLRMVAPGSDNMKVWPDSTYMEHTWLSDMPSQHGVWVLGRWRIWSSGGAPLMLAMVLGGGWYQREWWASREPLRWLRRDDASNSGGGGWHTWVSRWGDDPPLNDGHVPLAGNDSHHESNSHHEGADEYIDLTYYIRIGLDSTFTEHITWIKREDMKRAMQMFLQKFFVYDAKTHTVTFQASQITYEDVEKLYHDLQLSKNGLWKAATTKIPVLGISLKKDPLGGNIDEFLEWLCEPWSDLYRLFVSCTVGVVGHMQLRIKTDLGIDTVDFVTDSGRLIGPTTFVTSLCGLKKG